MTKTINNVKNGHHLNSQYWQHYKKNLPLLPAHLFDISIGMILGDASMYKVSREAYIKFEQGYKQKVFLHDLFNIFSTYVFMQQPGKRLSACAAGLQHPEIKSFWFKTFSHESFTKLFNLFYTQKLCNNVIVKTKTIPKNLVLDYLTAQGLAYWIMCDGSLQNDKKTIILHTQKFNLIENSILSV